MSTIVTRSGKGSKLTHAEMDANLNNLNNDKLEKGQYAANNTIVYKDNGGNLASATVAEQTLVGRITGGQVKALTKTEAKTLLDVDDLEAAAPALRVIAHGTGTLVAGTKTITIGVPFQRVVVTRTLFGGTTGHLKVTYLALDCVVESSSNLDTGSFEYIVFI